MEGVTLQDLDMEHAQTLYSRTEIVTILKARLKADPQIELAIKVLPYKDAQEAQTYMKEAIAMASLPHQHIATLENIEFRERKAYMIMKFFKEGDLDTLIRSRARDRRFWTEAELLDLFRQLLSGFEYLEQHQVAHRDIKPQNIFVESSSDGQIYLLIGDLGCTQKSENLIDRSLSDTVTGTPMYMSPLLRSSYLQVLQGGSPVMHNPFKSDVFSLGLVFLYMASLIPPSDLTNHHRLEERIADRLITISSPTVKELIESMLKIDERTRCTFKQALNDVDKALNKGCPVFESEQEIDQLCKLCEAARACKISSHCGHNHWCRNCIQTRFGEIQAAVSSVYNCPRCLPYYKLKPNS